MIVTLDQQYKGPKPPSRKEKKGEMDIRLATVNELLETASNVVEMAAEGSTIFDAAIEERLPRFNDREVSTGSIIGRGGFCVVRDIDKIRAGKVRRGSFNSTFSSSSAASEPKRTNSVVPPRKGGFFELCFGRFAIENKTDSNNMSSKGLGNTSVHSCDKSLGESEDKFSREYVAYHSKGRKGKRFVLKSVSKDLDKINYMKGNVDIAMEAKYLSALSHPNIIELVAISASAPCTPGYFLVLEKMKETLTSRIKKWMDRERLNKGVMGMITGGKKKEQELYRERIAASYDIASALFYLHSKNVIFRDLKPANIGFDSSDQLKLFDFGLAKELRESEKRNDGTYRNMTALTGAVRYMAPEVGLGLCYNLSADVYSWAMVMWFILALEPPFGFFTEEMILNRVQAKGVRPAIFRRWNEVIGGILKASWDANLHNRPDFLEITLVLKQELIECDTGGTVCGYSVDDSENGAYEQNCHTSFQPKKKTPANSRQ